MTSAFAVAVFALLIAMAIAMVRMFKGPYLHDRVLAANSFGTKIVLFIAALGFLAGRPEFLDISLLYVLLTFISTIAVLRFIGLNKHRAEQEEEQGQ